MEEDLTPIESILQKRRDAAKESSHIKGVGESVGSNVKGLLDYFQNLTRTEQKELLKMFKEQGMRVTNLDEIVNAVDRNKPSLSLPISIKLDDLDVDTVTIHGLEEAMAEIVTSISDIAQGVQKAISEIKFDIPKPEVTVNVPEVKLPTINVPEPKVTVNVPKPTIIREGQAQPFSNPFSQKKSIPIKEEVRLLQEKPIYTEDGDLDGFTEVYSDGSTVEKTGLSTMNIKYKYGNV